VRFADGLKQGCAGTWRRYIGLAPLRKYHCSGVLFYFPERCVFDSSDPRNTTRNKQLESVMSTPNEPADPIAKGVIPTALQNLSDLLVWKQRVIVKNDFGEETCEWQTPEPLKNPFSLLAQLSARDVGCINLENSSTAVDSQFIVAFLHLRPSGLDGGCIRLPRGLHPDHEICCLLQKKQHRHHHSLNADPPVTFSGCSLLRSRRRQIWAQMANGH
jgi:hypothetical protein